MLFRGLSHFLSRLRDNILLKGFPEAGAMHAIVLWQSVEEREGGLHIVDRL
jgi:hypothetical protein